MRLLLLVAAMIHRGGFFRIAVVIFVGFCLVAIGAILLGH